MLTRNKPHTIEYRHPKDNISAPIASCAWWNSLFVEVGHDTLHMGHSKIQHRMCRVLLCISHGNKFTKTTYEFVGCTAEQQRIVLGIGPAKSVEKYCLANLIRAITCARSDRNSSSSRRTYHLFSLPKIHRAASFELPHQRCGAGQKRVQTSSTECDTSPPPC